MSNESIILCENDSIFSPVSVLHYTYFKDEKRVVHDLRKDENLQCIVGENNIPFGRSQSPDLFDYADGIDTMQFLLSL